MIGELRRVGEAMFVLMWWGSSLHKLGQWQLGDLDLESRWTGEGERSLLVFAQLFRSYRNESFCDRLE